jgi:uncharacterized membrane protein
MQLSKSTFLSILGLLGLVFVIAMAYVNSYAFLDKIIVCTFIVGLIFLIKMRGEVHNSKRNSNA